MAHNKFCPFTKESCSSDCVLHSDDEFFPCSLQLGGYGEHCDLVHQIECISTKLESIEKLLAELNRR